MHKFYMLIVFMILNYIGHAQCPPGIYTNSQNDIDSFIIRYPNCETLTENVTIVGETINGKWGVKINNLRGLRNIQSIGGNLKLSRSSLKKLEGLDNLKFIGGDLRISFNDSLQDISQLKQIDSIGGGLKLSLNRALSSLKGLEGISTAQFVYIINNNELVNFTGLESLTKIIGLLNISVNDKLKSLKGIENLSTVSRIIVANNDNLKNISGLQNIHANSIVSDYYGNLGFRIIDNLLLKDCSINSVCDYLNLSDFSAEIDNNLIGCNSIEEIISSCKQRALMSERKTDIQIYPNPTNSEIIINNIGEEKIRILSIYNEIGKLIQKLEVSGETIDVSFLARGVYMLRFEMETHQVIHKLVITQ